MKVQLSETSLQAFKENKETFDNRAAQVLDVIKTVGPMTGNEVFQELQKIYTFPKGYRHNTNARLSGLRDEGLICVTGKRACTVTGAVCSVWDVVPEEKKFFYKKEALDQKLVAAKALVAKLEKAISESI